MSQDESLRSNVNIVPNVMVDGLTGGEEIRALPGDFAVQVYRRWYSSKESLRQVLTDEQWEEHLQYLVCFRCNRPCAGTCSLP